jgi:dUTP pyrophosphatase
VPEYATAGASGADLYALHDDVVDVHGVRAVRTGIAIELSPGYEAQVRPRSGLAVKHGVTVLNAPGTIDCDYRGEIVVLLINHGMHSYACRAGDRVAQLVIAPVTRAQYCQVDGLEDTQRGTGGFGSTGT